ncbi:hypothetical protein GCM10011414_22010 [Croceivirga lutea]|nr:hypothetical protein GCM10011414_22010 [Croceivirga lutea]
MGVSQYLLQAFMPIEALEQMSQNERALFESKPAWVTASFAIAVFGGTLASIALLLRKKWARPVFLISLIAAIAQFIHWLFLTNATEVYGTSTYIMPILVIIFGIYEVYFAKQGIKKNWLK